MECGNCTLCCKLTEIRSLPTPSPIDTYCEWCSPGVGCRNYSSRPDECRKYQCMWSQMSNVVVGLRPDLSHIIFERASDDVINARLEKNHKMSRLVVGQIRAFNSEGFSVFVLRGRSSICFPAEKHSQEYVRKVVNDCAKLYRRLN